MVLIIIIIFLNYNRLHGTAIPEGFEESIGDIHPLCDYDIDCDNNDFKIFNGFLGKCLVPYVSTSTMVQSDVDSDGCITKKDQDWLFGRPLDTTIYYG